MDLDAEDTIVAIASVRQGAARGIVRVSGPATLELLRPRFRPAHAISLDQVRRPSAIGGRLCAGPPMGDIPGQLLLWPTAASYTRQVSAEFHTWGCVPLLDAIVESLCRAGARLARPGEFTLRAFLAGRIDLTQAEAVLGVIDAVDQRQLQGALEQLAGGLAGPLSRLRDQLLDLLADLEAGLDFADEDIQFVERGPLIERLEQAAGQLAGLQSRIDARTVAQDAPLVVLAGMPNVGKSTLCNALSGQDHAIVSDVSGTTRDYLMATVALGAVVVRLVDTAGLIEQAGDDPLHAASQEASHRIFQQADLRLLCLDATRPLSPWERAALAVHDDRRLVIRNKCDSSVVGMAPPGALEVSARTGDGLEELKRQIAERLCGARGAESPVVQATAVRCAESLRLSRECLDQALSLARGDGSEELIAGLLRGALDSLGMVAGQVYTDDLLDRVFGRFCIGK